MLSYDLTDSKLSTSGLVFWFICLIIRLSVTTAFLDHFLTLHFMKIQTEFFTWAGNPIRGVCFLSANLTFPSTSHNFYCCSPFAVQYASKNCEPQITLSPSYTNVTDKINMQKCINMHFY